MWISRVADANKKSKQIIEATKVISKKHRGKIPSYY